jgi:two-component sensor histidine kinase
LVINFSLIGFALLILIIVIVLVSYRNKRIANISLGLKNQEIEHSSAIITFQKQAVDESNSKLKKLLADKELLFKEVHHRVKNNLQIISSLLNLQSHTISDEKVLDILKQSQSRINTMAILHNKLYQTEDFSNIPFDEYLKQLVISISDSFDTKCGDVKFVIDADKEIRLNIDVAIPFGLILNELITNSFKHAFIGKQQGLISVSLKMIGSDRYHLVFTDNGNGLPDNYREFMSKSLGLELIEMLVEQLNGCIGIKNNGGASFDISFGNPISN